MPPVKLRLRGSHTKNEKIGSREDFCHADKVPDINHGEGRVGIPTWAQASTATISILVKGAEEKEKSGQGGERGLIILRWAWEPYEAASVCTPGYLWSPETKKYEVPMSGHDGLKSRITSNVIHAPSTDEV